MGPLELRRRREATLYERITEINDEVQDARQRLETLVERKRVASVSRNTRTFELRKAAVIRLESGKGDLVPAIVLRTDGCVWQSTGDPWIDVQVAAREQAIHTAGLGQGEGEAPAAAKEELPGIDDSGEAVEHDHASRSATADLDGFVTWTAPLRGFGREELQLQWTLVVHDDVTGL